MKTKCNKCKEVKDRTEVHVWSRRKRKDGTFGSTRYICRPCENARMRKYYKENTTKVRGIVAKSTRKYSTKQRARELLNAALKDGRVVKPKACSCCGKRKYKRLEAHHDDYSKPLEVRWLASDCHARVHREMRLAGKE